MGTNTVVFITGCSSGIGFQTALLFARHGYTVFAGVRDLHSQGVSEFKTIAEREQRTLHMIRIDITDATSVNKAVRGIQEKVGRIDVLINNAGVMFLGPVEMFTIEEVKEQFDTNFFGTLRVIQAVVPLMREQKAGKIINVSSINGLLSFPLYGIYSGSKFALETITEVLRFELRPFGITVTLVEPGTFTTNFWKNRKHPHDMKSPNSPYKALSSFLDTIDQKQKGKQHSLLTRFTHPQRVATSIYAVSQKAHPKLRYVVGIDAKFFLILRKLLPESIRTALLRKVYKW